MFRVSSRDPMAPATSGLTNSITRTRALARSWTGRHSNPVVRHGQTEGRMFTNLIESSSHAKEFKRRGSFLLFTTATYLVLFVVTGVISIYAYDARLEQQNLELIVLVAPVEWVEPDRQPAAQPDRPEPTRDNDQSNIPTREIARSEEHTSELQSLAYLVCRLLLEKKNNSQQST